MTLLDTELLVCYTAVLVMLIVAILVLGRRIRQLSELLDNVRFGTVELVNALQAETADLQDSLREAGIPLVCTRMNERMRYLSLSPDERYRETQERWEATVAQVEQMRDRLDAEAEKEWRKHDGLD